MNPVGTENVLFMQKVHNKTPGSKCRRWVKKTVQLLRKGSCTTYFHGGVRCCRPWSMRFSCFCNSITTRWIQKSARIIIRKVTKKSFVVRMIQIYFLHCCTILFSGGWMFLSFSQLWLFLDLGLRNLDVPSSPEWIMNWERTHVLRLNAIFLGLSVEERNV